ncbi:MAG: DUF2835 domain-containing protein [Gammaproteobacteria bacterium]|nr:DUF2835 domain-containing protein [Gammaproteobacteria bacterium]
MNTLHSLRFRLSISPEEYLAYYKGQAHDAIARSEDGRRVQFPAKALQAHITHQGIHGLFELRFDANHKLLELKRLGD